MDFSKSLMHCSIAAYFMADGREKTPKQKWLDAVQLLEESRTKYNSLEDKKKIQVPGVKLLKKITDLELTVHELAKNKDDEPLSKTAKSYLKRYYAYLKYGKRSAALDKGNKYTNKGKLGEPASIELISFLDDRPYKKNTIRLTNDFLTGEPDIIYWDRQSVENPNLYIIDVKTNWDIETFMDCLGKELSPLYWWQLQAYFALTGADKGEVSYCLVNTPESILIKEKYYLAERMNCAIDASTDPEYMAAERELVNNMTFSDMPHAERRIKFTVERDQEAIDKLYKRIEKCREYLAEIEALHLTGTFAAKEIPQEVGEVEEME